MTVREMLNRMDSRELSEWIAFASVEPIGERRADARMAANTCRLANLIKSACGSKDELLTLEDCMLTFDPPEQQTPQEMKAMLGIRGK